MGDQYPCTADVIRSDIKEFCHASNDIWENLSCKAHARGKSKNMFAPLSERNKYLDRGAFQDCDLTNEFETV